MGKGSFLASHLADLPPNATARQAPEVGLTELGRRLQALGLITKISRMRSWRVTGYGGKVVGTSLYLREHQFPNVYPGVMHWSSSRRTKNSLRKNLCAGGPRLIDVRLADGFGH